MGEILPNIFIPKISFILATEFRGQIKKNWGENGGKRLMCIKGWFKPIFPH